MGSEFINFVGLFFGVTPPLIFALMLKGATPVYHRYWLFGVFFIIISAAFFALLDGLTKAVLSLKFEEEVINDVKNALAIWAYIGPAASLAIGANLITQFLILAKPETPFSQRVSEMFNKKSAIKGFIDFILSAPAPLNWLALISIISIVIKPLLFDKIPELFNGAKELGIILEAVLASVIASYIFYLIVVHKKQCDDNQLILPLVNKWARSLVSDCKGLLNAIAKESDTELAFEKLDESQLKIALEKIDLNRNSAPLHIYAQGAATWFQYLSYNRTRALENTSSIFSQVVFLDAEFASKIIKINDSHYLNQIELVAEFPINNTEAQFLSKPLYDYVQCCRDLDEYLGKNEK
ncbi:hypothetical protein BB427_03180 [Pseudoalteromonas sp. BMB]|uniref:hypothetical protein n=1 Tax=Pseudoalteromonas sp. BMB TaxID=1874619 RepID=UPI00083CC18B|nr:hypothetical protein [Pseudoalteromonas sp. BMB]ODB35618.1 hypothetical protein BB427_03180 [Pseudoalteromonas sp. BMB]